MLAALLSSQKERSLNRRLQLPSLAQIGRASLASQRAALTLDSLLAEPPLGVVLYAGLAVARKLGSRAQAWPSVQLEAALQLAAEGHGYGALLSALRSDGERARWAAGGGAAFARSSEFVTLCRARLAEGRTPPAPAELDVDGARPLGHGGHAVVYAATRRATGARYALKVLRPPPEPQPQPQPQPHSPQPQTSSAGPLGASDDDTTRWLLSREAGGAHSSSERAAAIVRAQLRRRQAELARAEAAALRAAAAGGCVAVVRLAYLLTAGPWAQAGPGLALEACAGGSLESLLAGRTGAGSSRLSHAASAYVGARVLCGLQALHSAGWAWRDCKPGNVLLKAGGQVRIADLGLAARLEPGPGQDRGQQGPGGQQGQAQAVRGGTVGYLSPEDLRQGLAPGPGQGLGGLGLQWLGLPWGGPPAAPDPASAAAASAGPSALCTVGSDLWKVGVTLYLCLTGQHPHLRLIPAEQRLQLQLLEQRSRRQLRKGPSRGEEGAAAEPRPAMAAVRAGSSAWAQRVASAVLACPVPPPPPLPLPPAAGGAQQARPPPASPPPPWWPQPQQPQQQQAQEEAQPPGAVPFPGSELSPQAAHLLQALLCSEPGLRLSSMAAVCAHPFFAEPGSPARPQAPARAASHASALSAGPAESGGAGPEPRLAEGARGAALFEPRADPQPPEDLARAAMLQAAYLRSRTNRPAPAAAHHIAWRAPAVPAASADEAAEGLEPDVAERGALQHEMAEAMLIRGRRF